MIFRPISPLTYANILAEGEMTRAAPGGTDPSASRAAPNCTRGRIEPIGPDVIGAEIARVDEYTRGICSDEMRERSLLPGGIRAGAVESDFDALAQGCHPA